MNITLSATFPNQSSLQDFVNRLKFNFSDYKFTENIDSYDQGDEIILEIKNVPKELEKNIQEIVMNCGGRNRVG
ncbi:hypothetical protein [Oscillatoria sp. HE19RPO]|uniref:hypothetical protein n=1 Tax=Oscillatoria sp. HE19RPO TaxID=2954806 RepID=UPI0020C2BF33|nr:hypothetical protein [Oscillatoria sp. HE19RPO]